MRKQHFVGIMIIGLLTTAGVLFARQFDLGHDEGSDYVKFDTSKDN